MQYVFGYAFKYNTITKPVDVPECIFCKERIYKSVLEPGIIFYSAHQIAMAGHMR